MKSKFIKFSILMACLSLALTTRACEQCKCYGTQPVDLLSGLGDIYKKSATSPAAGTTAAPGSPPSSTNPAVPTAPNAAALPVGESSEQRTKWSFDTLFEWTEYQHQNIQQAHAILELGRDTHAHLKEYNVTEHFGYAVTEDLHVGLSQGFRSLYLREIENTDNLGARERSEGANDLDLGVQYRFLHQNQCGCPVDMLVFADLKAPTGVTNNRRPQGDLFETEDQPGTGSWNETIGISVGKRWGQWAASAAYAFTHKGEGSQEFKMGDVNRLSITASRKISPDDWDVKVFLSQGVQGFIENKSVDHGVTSPDHGGTFAYAVPGVSVIPIRRLILTATGSVPIYQQENGFHQKDKFGVQFNVGVRF